MVRIEADASIDRPEFLSEPTRRPQLEAQRPSWARYANAVAADSLLPNARLRGFGHHAVGSYHEFDHLPLTGRNLGQDPADLAHRPFAVHVRRSQHGVVRGLHRRVDQ